MRSTHPIRPVLMSVVVPTLLLATVVPFDGGSRPLDLNVARPVALSRAHADYGQIIRVRPLAAVRPGTTVTLRFRSGKRDSAVARRRADRRGTWSVALRATRSGSFYAVEGPSVIAASSEDGATAAGSRLRVRAVIRSPDALSTGSAARPKLRFTVLPAGGAHWRISIRRGRGWKVLAHGRVHHSRITVPIPRVTTRGLLRIDVAASGTTDRARPREVRLISMRPALASWYDLVGGGLACGGVLRADQMGVAHKTLPCGTKVTISYRSRTVTVPVIDRGPYIAGREFDLTGATARALGFDGVDTVMVSP